MKTYNEKSATERHGTLSQPRVYLGGAITGFKREEYLEKFSNVEKQFREKGWAVINPAAVCDELPEMTHESYMRIALSLLRFSSAIYVIDGEAESEGVKEEIEFAEEECVERIFDILPPSNCGSCENFNNDDVFGYGFCERFKNVTHCGIFGCREYKKS